jgi:N-dimethylarginine dimethylaminohydrolase
MEGLNPANDDGGAMTQILMCAPDHYGIEYEINPWMRISNRTNADRAQAQWRELVGTLRGIGASIELLSPVAGLPDLVFTANAGSVEGNIAVPSRFRHPERQREELTFIKWFETHGFTVVRLDAGVYFEGDGDLLGFPGVRFGGYRQRSDIRAYAHLSEIFQVEIIPLELTNSYFYHLDTCFCPLSGGDLLYYPAAFDPYALTVIAERVDKSRRLEVSEHDAMRFACNAVCIGRHVALPSGCEDTERLLKDHGYEPHPLVLDEFLKAGGSAKCLTLALE